MFRCLLLTSMLFAQDHPTGNRTTPPTIASVSPNGAARGTTVELTVEGFNLARASGIYFSEAGIKAKILRVKELPDLNEVRLGSNGTPSTIDLGPLPPRNQVTIELDIDPEAPVGPVNFRIQTPLGTSPAGTLLVEPYYGESPDQEPNDTPDTAFETYLPSVLAGTISKPGDLDFYKIKVRAGEELVFDNGAMQLGSMLQPLVAIVTEDGTVLKEYGYDGGQSVSNFAHRFSTAGTYYVRVSDYQRSGGARHIYRLKVGNFPLVSGAYPLGLRAGAKVKVTLSGYGLGTAETSVEGKASLEDPDAVFLRPDTPNGLAFNRVRLALGMDPEVESNGRNLSASTAQPVAWPATVNGVIERDQFFRVSAKKGETIHLEVNARRLGSNLDSVVEVLDAKGAAIERAVIRPVWDTILVLRDHDSVARGLRIQNWNALKVGDYVQVGSEIIRVFALPRSPDDDAIFENFNGQRLAFFGTSTESHANDSAVYKVQVHPPGAHFTANGLPLTRLYYRNDDGGPIFGKDSYLEFVAPSDGDYLIRLGDSRGEGGPYRLSIRQPRPDFRLSVNPVNPNVPAGGAIPLTVSCVRLDGFAGAIQVSLENLPPGLTAPASVIAPGQTATTVLLSAAPNATLGSAVELRAVGRAGKLMQVASPEEKLKLISLMPASDVTMTALTKVVELEPGGTAEVEVSITRQNGFGGRVPVQIMNLPPRVRVLDVGLNGVLLNETETKRTFTLEALAIAEPLEQLIYVGGTVETRSPLQNLYAAPQAILLRVKPSNQVSRNNSGSDPAQPRSNTQN
jgi:hypothetical protein